MRQLFLLLCLLNGAATLWWSTSEGKSVKPVITDPGRVSSLDLLAESVVEQETRPGRDQRCQLYGPMGARRVETLAAAIGRGARIVAVRRSQPGEHWLYIPAGGGSADRVIDELGYGGVESFVFLGGELAGSVALGGYSSLEAAERDRQRYAAMGYEVAVHEMTREIIDYWVALPAGMGGETTAAVAAVMGPLLEKPKIVENSCEVVASRGQFP